MRLISWNIDHPTEPRDVESVIRVLRESEPDVVALQEVARRIPQELMEGLSKLGLGCSPPYIPPKRGWGLLVASRWPLQPLEGAFLRIPKDEKSYFRGNHPIEDGEPARLLSVLVNRPGGAFELHTVHVPPGSQVGWRKIDTLRAVARRMAVGSTFHRILCGDFNEPRAELPDGGVESWADYNKYSKDPSRQKPKRWQEAVESIFMDLPKEGMVDVFRAVHGERVCELVSHIPRKQGKPRRYDHVFATHVLEPLEARYLPKDMWEGISDHAPAEVVFRD
jgi:endonuclease/exonuclease/phosphatase family metal-dependent hydrolase